jgi:hypothetical protein
MAGSPFRFCRLQQNQAKNGLAGAGMEAEIVLNFVQFSY